MPPSGEPDLIATASSLSQQCSALVSERKQVANTQAPAGSAEEAERRVVEWIERANATMSSGQKCVEELRDFIDEQFREVDAKPAQEALHRLQGVLKQLQAALREGKLDAKVAAEKRAQEQYLELTDLPNGRARKGMEETAMEVTQSLAAALQMMTAEVERSAEAAQVLEKQTALLKQTRDEYGAYSDVLSRSAKLVSELASRDWFDRMMLLFGVLVFLASSLYVVRRRVGWMFAFSLGSPSPSVLSASSSTLSTTSTLLGATAADVWETANATPSVWGKDGGDL